MSMHLILSHLKLLDGSYEIPNTIKSYSDENLAFKSNENCTNKAKFVLFLCDNNKK